MRRYGSSSVTERGAVTAEVAVALPALVLVTVTLMWLVSVAAAQIRCADAAREAARVLARGDKSDDAQAIVARTAPPGSSMTSQVRDDVVEVRVRADIRPPGSLGRVLPAAAVVGSATAWLEPDSNASTGAAWAERGTDADAEPAGRRSGADAATGSPP
jgi:TadE-like protein